MASENIWDGVHVKALIALQRHPLQIIQSDPWQSWIDQHGGISKVRDQLRSLAMPPQLHDLLNNILDAPYESITYYTNQLNVSRRTYTNYLNSLTDTLVSYLNGWDTTYQKPLPCLNADLSLPAPLTAVIGMDELLESTCNLLAREDVRLVTITGMGGVGKTRLAVQAAKLIRQAFLDGVLFVSLETVENAQQVEQEIANRLLLDSAGDALRELKKYFKGLQHLLVLDSFEHVTGAAPLITSLLAAAPGLKILVTSREALKLYGEHRVAAPLFTVPENTIQSSFEEISNNAAVRLFVTRAQAVQPSFELTENNLPDVLAICRCLDGLPLAIELAAARVPTFSPPQIRDLLERSFAFLEDGPRDRPLRQQTLWNTVDWSYQLLSEPEKILLDQLAKLEGSFGLEEAAEIYDLEQAPKVLETLVMKNLVLVDCDLCQEETKPFRLPNVIRQYALNKPAP